MRSLVAILLYAIAKAIWPQLNPRTPGNVSEYDPQVRRYIQLLNAMPQQRGPECQAVECDLEDTQPLYPERYLKLLDSADDTRREGFDTPSSGFDQ